MKTFFVQADSENLNKRLNRLTQQTIQMISLSHFSYKDLLLMEISDRERHYKKFVDNQKEQVNNLNKKPSSINKQGFSRFG